MPGLTPFLSHRDFLKACGLALAGAGAAQLATPPQPVSAAVYNEPVTINGPLTVKAGNGDQLLLDNAGETWVQQNFAVSGVPKAFIALDAPSHNFIVGGQGSYSQFDRVSIRPNGSSDSLVVKRTGTVGIGTAMPDPTVRLEVSGSTKISNGGLGIGTSPGAKLHVKGGNGDQLVLDNNDEQWVQQNFLVGGTQKTFIALDHSAHAFIIGGQGTYAQDPIAPFDRVAIRPNGSTADALVVKRTGNVGIGTTMPSATLEVVGNVKITGPQSSLAVSAGAITCGSRVVANDNGCLYA